MLADFASENWLDASGNPAGGVVFGAGMCISWQNGPLGPPQGPRRTPNGAFVETVIAAAKQRIEHYQESKFACEENANAIRCLNEALGHLNSRTQRRTKAGVEGTHAEEVKPA